MFTHLRESLWLPNFWPYLCTACMWYSDNITNLSLHVAVFVSILYMLIIADGDYCEICSRYNPPISFSVVIAHQIHVMACAIHQINQ